MSDVSQGEGWWLASDGKWYPPESRPAPPLLPPPPEPPAPATVQAGALPRESPRPANPRPLSSGFITWTKVIMWVVAAVGATAALMANGYRATYAALVSGRGSARETVAAEEAFLLAAQWFQFLWIIGAITLIIWSAKAHTATTALLRSPTERTYSWGWTVGVWFIPIANLFSTPRVLGEHQRIADAERNGNEVVADWREVPRRPTLVWWWVLTVVGMVLVFTGGQSAGSLTSSDDEFLTGLALASVGYTAFAAGVACGAVFISQVSAQLRAQR